MRQPVDSKARRREEAHRTMIAPGKEDRRKPKANFAFKGWHWNLKTGEEEEEESKIQLIIN